ncbi:MAG: TetR family transcriptional regulator [Solirubrobacterales bacterium]|nr:TetR family transcriptional regulator [Solirubrobacterales bacterium]
MPLAQSGVQRRELESSEARRRVLDAAVDAFAERGFGGTSTRDVAVRAGRSPAAVYVHYDSKEALLYAISLEGHMAALDCLKLAYASSEDPAARLHAMVFAFSDWHMENARLARVVQYELHALSKVHRADIVSLRRRFHRVMVGAVRDGIRAGQFQVDDVNGTARALLSLCIDLVRWFDPARGRNSRAIAQLNADLALRMVGDV